MAKATTYDVHTIGRRKTSVARIYLVKGSGKITINHREFKEYFPLAISRTVITQPLELVKATESYDVIVNVAGGGLTGQAGAIRLGLARALEKLQPSTRPELKKAGFLTRDSREVERKKYGRHGARRSCQFSKR